MGTRGLMKTAGTAFLGAALTMGSWAFAASPAAAHGACRRPAGVDRVSGLNASARVSCATARQVAAAYDQRVMQGGQFPGQERIRAKGFACVTRPAPGQEETFQVKCTARGGKVVRFTWGV